MQCRFTNKTPNNTSLQNLQALLLFYLGWQAQNYSGNKRAPETHCKSLAGVRPQVFFFHRSWMSKSSNLPGCRVPKLQLCCSAALNRSIYCFGIACALAQRFSANSREVPLFVQFARHCEDLPRDLPGRSQGTIKSSSGFDPM